MNGVSSFLSTSVNPASGCAMIQPAFRYYGKAADLFSHASAVVSRCVPDASEGLPVDVPQDSDGLMENLQDSECKQTRAK